MRNLAWGGGEASCKERDYANHTTSLGSAVHIIESQLMILHRTVCVLWFNHTSTQLPDMKHLPRKPESVALPVNLKLHITQGIIPELTVVGGQAVSTGWPHSHSVLDACSFCGQGTKLLPQAGHGPACPHQPAVLLRNSPWCLSLLLVPGPLSILGQQSPQVTERIMDSSNQLCSQAVVCGQYFEYNPWLRITKKTSP